MNIDTLLNDKYSYLTELLKKAYELVYQERFSKYRLSILDEIHVGFIELILIEKVIYNKDPIETIGIMSKILSLDKHGKNDWETTLNQLEVLIKKQQEKERFLDDTVEFKDDGSNTGCLLYIVYEKGLYLKLYGELNSKLLAEATEATNSYKEKLEYYSKGWGEVVDFRHWNLLTNDSLLSGKENNIRAAALNKEYTIYIINETPVDKYIAKNLLGDTMNYAYKFTKADAISMMNENKFDFGDVVHLDYVGSLKYIEDEK
jgi:hypothetical protein